MKKFTVSFKRKAIYTEEGYVTVEASNASDAKQIALEYLEEGNDPCNLDGNVSEIWFVEDSPLPEPDVNILSVEKDDFIDGYDDCDEIDEEYEDEYSSSEYDDEYDYGY